MSDSELRVRKVDIFDARDVWEWWNDPLTRQMMAKKNFVPWDEHQQWFRRLIEDDNRLMCIGVCRESKVGVVRFDLRESASKLWEVSINLNPKFRGRGLASIFLTASCDFFSQRHHNAILYANVGVVNNIASQRTFERAGFLRTPDPVNEFHYELSIIRRKTLVTDK